MSNGDLICHLVKVELKHEFKILCSNVFCTHELKGNSKMWSWMCLFSIWAETKYLKWPLMCILGLRAETKSKIWF